MDGVLSDFDRQLEEHNISKSLPRGEFWEKVHNTPGFWIKMKVMPGARSLVDYVQTLKVPIEILTSPSKSDPKCKPGKMVWCRTHGFNFKLNFKRAQFKHEMAEEGAVLIDDKPETIQEWIQAGGIGIWHRNVGDTIRELKKYGHEIQEDKEKA